MLHSFRQLWKNPGFTFVAVLTLGLGIGANATILGIVHAFFFEPLQVRASERLVMLLQKSSAWKFPHGHSWLDVDDYRRRVPEFESVLATFLSPAHIAAPGKPAQRTWIECVSGGYFDLLGVPPAQGRTFAAGEGVSPGADPVIVLSHGWWQREFGSAGDVVGRTLNLNGKPFSVIGVMPADFGGAQWSIGTAAWVPATMMGDLVEGGKSLLESRDSPAFKTMARLKPGATLTAARASAEVVHRQLLAEYPQSHRESTLLVVPEQQCRPEPTFSEVMPFAAVMFLGLVGFVLLIACANVANLMFARALGRQRELAIRAALGASRGRLVRQLLFESVLLALLAGLLGTALSAGFGIFLSDLTPAGDIPMSTQSRWSWTVFFLTLVVAVLAGLVTGLVPALRATRLDLQSALKDGGATLAGSLRHPFRSFLVVTQLALSLAVLICGGLFVDSLRRVARIDLGFRTENLVMASLDLGLQGYDDNRGQEFLRQLVERARALPGVEAAAVARGVPFDYGVMLTDVGAEGRVVDGPPSPNDGYVIAGCNQVDPGYLSTLGVVLLQGRAFTTFDRRDSPKVAIINQTMARRLFPNEDPVGRRIRVGRGGQFCEVIGVARDGKYVMVGEEPRPYAYLPLAQDYRSPATLHVRTSGDPLAIAPAIRRILAELDPHLPIYNVRTMDEHLRQSALALMPLRVAAILAAVQGVLGVGLAVMGIYGVVSYMAARRTREIGLRMALGAGRRDILRLVIRDGSRLTAMGLGLGLLLAIGMAFGLARLLYGLSPVNLPVFAGVLILLGGVSLLACYLPARRAARLDPLAALRTE